MGKGSGNGTTRGDRRNARRERLRGLLPRDGAVIGIDLAEDKQALAVVDHDVRVLALMPVLDPPTLRGIVLADRCCPFAAGLRLAHRPDRRLPGLPPPCDDLTGGVMPYIAGLHSQALDAAGRVVAGIAADRWHLATPCEDALAGPLLVPSGASLRAHFLAVPGRAG